MRRPNLGCVVSLAAFWTLSAADKAAADAQEAVNAYLSSLSVTTVSGPVSGRLTDLASARAAILAGNYTLKLHHETRNRCPASCSHATLNSSAWYVYHDVNRLKACNETMLLEFALFNPVNDMKSHISISACVADLQASASDNAKSIIVCVPNKNVKRVRTESFVQFASSGSSVLTNVTDVVAALD